MPQFDLLPSFNAGELSPFLDSRTNLEKYRSGARVLENYIPLPYGGVNRRPGMEYVATTLQTAASWTCSAKGNSGGTLELATNARLSVGERIVISGTTYTVNWVDGSVVWIQTLAGALVTFTDPAIPSAPFTFTTPGGNAARLFSFNYSPTTRYIIEIGNHCIRIHRGDGAPSVAWSLVGASGSDNVPYSDVNLRDIQMVQINDVVYIAHQLHPLYKLTRLSDTSWTLRAVEYSFPPTMEENTDDTVTLTASATTGNINLTASATGRVGAGFFWSRRDIGSLWAITHRRDTFTSGISLSASGSSSAVYALGQWEITTSGSWTGNVYLQRQEIGKTTWENIRQMNSVSDRNFTLSGTQDYPAMLRLTSVSTTGTGRALLTLSSARQTGIVRITGITSGTVATATVVVPLFATTATSFWAEAAFSDFRGQPSALALHEQRLFLSGNNSRRMTVWGSQIDDFENFRTGTLDTDGLSITLASGRQNTIEWMISQDSLIIGTNGDEWALGSSDAEKALSPTNIRATNQSRYGSAHIPGIMLADVVLFIQRNGRKVREFVYSFESDSWIAADLTLLAEHVTRGGIQEVAYQQQPDAILWAVRGDGQLVGMTYERDQNVVGWHRHTTDGAVESVAIINGNGTEDEIWFVVRRTVGGNTVRYIERFSLFWRQYLDEGTSSAWNYLDSSVRFTNSPASATVTGLSHLNGRTVTVLTSTGTVETRTVSGGSITLSAPATAGVVGLPYTSTLRPMRLNLDLQDGTSQGRKARIHGIVARLYQSRGGEVQTNSGSWLELAPATGITTGDIKRTLAGNFADTADITLRQTAPFPLTVLAIIPKWDAYGNE